MAHARVAHLKRLKSARQRVDKYYPFTISWVVMDDVFDEVKSWGATDQNEVVRGAERIWNDVCFGLEIYRTGETEGTRAEFMCEWLNEGYTWEECIAHLKTLSPTQDRKRERLRFLRQSRRIS